MDDIKHKPLFLALFSPKGGVGKSTLATQIAVASKMNKYTVAFYDLDKQQTSTFYFSMIDEKYKPDMIYNNLDIEPDFMPDIVIADCPPNLDVIPPKDFLIIAPTNTSILDLHAYRTVRELEEQGYNIIKVINNFSLVRNDDKDLLKDFNECVIISTNAAIRVAMNNGKTIWNSHHPNGKRAKKQFNYLLSRIKLGKAEEMTVEKFREIEK